MNENVTTHHFEIAGTLCTTQCPVFPQVKIGSATCGMCGYLSKIDTNTQTVECSFKLNPQEVEL